MATIEYSDGTKIEFSGAPTQQDAEEAYNQVKGIKPTVSNLTPTPEGGLQGFAKGIAKGEISTVKGLSDFGEKFASQTAGRFVNLIQGNGFTPTPVTSPLENVIGKEKTQELTIPQGTAENLGFGTEKIAEFLAPTGLMAKGTGALIKAAEGTPFASALGKTIIKGATEAGTTAGITKLQGGTDEQVKTNAIVSGLFSVGGSVLGGTINLLGKGTSKLGEKIQTTVIKPNRADIEDGFKVETLKKYNLGGSNEQVLAKTSNKLNELSTQLNQKLGTSNQAINLNKTFDDTVKALGDSKAKNFGNIQGTQRVLQSLKNEIEEVAGKNGLVSIPEGQLVKQGAGTKGSWVFGSADPDATAIEKVYNAFYKNLKTEIENASPAGVKEINKQISELIPIQRAVLRRIPIENRNNVVGLTDSIMLFGSLFNPKSLALLGAGRLSKSGKFGNFLTNIADSVKAPNKSALGQRVFGQANQSSAKVNQISEKVNIATKPNINNMSDIIP